MVGGLGGALIGNKACSSKAPRVGGRISSAGVSKFGRGVTRHQVSSQRETGALSKSSGSACQRRQTRTKGSLLPAPSTQHSQRGLRATAGRQSFAVRAQASGLLLRQTFAIEAGQRLAIEVFAWQRPDNDPARKRTGRHQLPPMRQATVDGCPKPRKSGELFNPTLTATV